MAPIFGLRGLRDGNGNLAWDATRPMETSGLRGIASGGIAAPAPARPTGLRRTGIFENGREWKGTSGTAGRGWGAFQNTPEAQAVRHNAEMNAIRDRNAEAIRNRRGIRTLGTSSGAEVAAYARANPSLGSGSGVFGRNDREAAMQRNRDFIRSGRASMFGPRPATTKGIMALREADYKEKELANQRHLEGLRQRGALEKERIAQQGAQGIERLRQEGENYRTGSADAKFTHERGMQSDVLADNQAARDAAAAEAEAARKHGFDLLRQQHKNAVELKGLDLQAAADARDWQAAQAAFDRGETARQFDENMGLLRSQEQQAQAQRDFDQNNVQNAENINGVWGVRQPDGTVRVFSPEYQQHLTDRYSKDVAGAVFNPKSGQWESHNIPVDRSLVAPREQRYAAVYEKLSKLDHPEYWTIALNRYGKPELTPRGSKLANGWQEVPEEDRGYIEWLTMPR